jgi:hypothetical protein
MFCLVYLPNFIMYKHQLCEMYMYPFLYNRCLFWELLCNSCLICEMQLQCQGIQTHSYPPPVHLVSAETSNNALWQHCIAYMFEMPLMVQSNCFCVCESAKRSHHAQCVLPWPLNTWAISKEMHTWQHCVNNDAIFPAISAVLLQNFWKLVQCILSP